MVQYSNFDSVEKEEQRTSQKTGKTCEAVSEGKVTILCLLKEADVNPNN